MASPDLLDFARFCAPIPGDNPAGKSLREDFSLRSSFQAIKDAQKAARDGEREAKRPPDADDKWKGARDLHIRLASCRDDWRKVLDLAAKITAEESKDLQIVSWWIEALLRIHGFPGVRDGFRLARELIEAYWEQLYPLPDEDGLATRVLPLALLNGVESDGVLAEPLTNLPITAAGSLRPMSLIDYQQANELERVQDAARRAQRVEDGAITADAFRKAVAETSTEHFAELLEDINACSEEFAKLTAVLDEKCGESHTPPSSNIRNALTAVREQVEQFVRDRGGRTVAATAGPSGGAAVAAATAASANGVGRLDTRDDAFRTLMQVADFFRRTEPQSPIPYLLDQAVRWGKMPLAELLGEMLSESVPDSLKLVGIRPPERKE